MPCTCIGLIENGVPDAVFNVPQARLRRAEDGLRWV